LAGALDETVAVTFPGYGQTRRDLAVAHRLTGFVRRHSVVRCSTTLTRTAILDRMTCFVLVHGAWRGSFGFRHVRRQLHEAGHEVFTPSLTGLGERVHLSSPQVTLSTHASDVVNQFLYEDLHDAVLMGYSYGGAVVTACLDHIHERVRDLVYLDAFVPEDGQSIADLVGLDPMPIELGQAYAIPSGPRSFDDPEEAEFQEARSVPQPLATAFEKVRLHKPLEAFDFTRTFIKATKTDSSEFGESAFAAAATRARNSDRWRYREIATNHMVLSNRPKELVEILLEVADST
jgi:pimeloyl-ACP methyl ester carboxylesterase